VKRACLPLLAAGLLFLAAPTGVLAAETFTADLSGANQVPPVTADGTGDATVTISDDGQSVSWDISYSGLTGDPAAGHIHFGAADVAGPVMIPFATVTPTGSSGTFAAADYQAGEGLPADWGGVLAAIRDGNAYVNIHTAANPPGEIRGQLQGAGGMPRTDTETVLPAKSDATTLVLLIATAMLALVIGRRRFSLRD